MAKIVSIQGSVDTNVVTATVTAAAGGVGAALQYYSASSKATIYNTSVTAGIEYKINSGAWKYVGFNTGADENINFASDILYFRKVASDNSLSTVEVSIDSVPTGYNSLPYGYNFGTQLNAVSPYGVAFNRVSRAPVMLGALMPTQVSTAFTGTHNLMITAPGDFDAVAAVAINYDTTAPFVIDNVAYAVSERSDTSKTVPIINGVQYNALAGATDQLGFVPGTWGGASSVSVPAATLAQSGSGVVIPKFVVGDLVPLSSIQRVDNPSAFPLVICRQFWNARTVSNFAFANAADVDALNAAMAPYEFYQVAQVAVNGCTSPSTFTSTWSLGASTLSGRILLMAFRLRGTGEFVLYCGDSIMQGIAANGDTNPNKPANNWNGHAGLTIKALASKTRPVGAFNIAFSGMRSADYLERLTSALPVLRPSNFVYPTYTPNDPNQGSVATQSLQYARMMTAADIGEQNKCFANFVTPTPGGGASIAAQQAMVAKIKTFRNIGVIDAGSAVTDVTNTGQSGWASVAYFDGTHPNAAGHSMMSAVEVAYFKNIFGG